LLVTTPISKPLLFPAFGRGGGGFAVGGEVFVVEGDADVFWLQWFSFLEQLGTATLPALAGATLRRLRSF